MKYGFSQKLFGYFYLSSCMKEAKRQKLDLDKKAIKKEYKTILLRASDIGKSRLMSSYCMGAYFIALNRKTTLSPEECFELYKNGLSNNALFHKVMGDADSYLDSRTDWPERMFHKYVLNMMMNAVNYGSVYTKNLFLYLYKTYYRKEYQQIKRFSKLSIGELMGIATSGWISLISSAAFFASMV